MDSNQSDDANIVLYHDPGGKTDVKLLARDGRIWLTQAQISDLFGTSVQNTSLHINNILKTGELEQSSVIKSYLITAADGKNYNVSHYSLEMILAVGFRVHSVRGTLFRQWAIKNLSEYLVKGFVIDDERLKNPDGRPDYFDELLLRIRDIRASEKRFYQKIRDLMALSSDYDKDDKSTQMFFAEVQNKLIYAVTGLTAAEIVVERSNPNAPNMGLRAWNGARVRKQDVIIAKNYLDENELDSLNQLVVVFLDQAELRVKRRHDLTLSFWRKNVDAFLNFSEMDVLQGKGSISHETMKHVANERYELFNEKRKAYEASLADKEDMESLKEIETELNDRKKKKGR